MSIPKRVTLQTAERALGFLEALANAGEPLRVKDVSAQLGVNLTTAYHLLNTLQSRDYVSRNGDGTLSLGPQVLTLYYAFQNQFPMAKELYSRVERLSNQTNETAYLGRLVTNGVLVEIQIESPQPLRVSGLGIGFVGKEHIRASGKAVLAFMDADHRDALFDLVFRSDPANDNPRFRAQLMRELEAIRGQGWAMDQEEYQAGVTCVAAPYFSADGSVQGAVGISAPSARLISSEDVFKSAVIDAAAEITRGSRGTDASR